MIDADPEADFLTWIHYDLLDGSRITESYSAAWNNAMNSEAEDKAFIVDFNKLPPMFPTHRHHPVFWEKLGRVIGTFGFLEEVLGKAIFAFTATTPYNEDEIEAAFERWLPTLEKALVDPLGGLIDAYGKAVRSNSAATVESLDELLDELRNASGIRNVLCHGSWRSPDERGRSLPLFVSRKKMVFDTPIDITFLEQTQQAVAKLTCVVINTVTLMGLQFPGSKGPGKVVF
jgi:hypothetical protein